MRELYKAPSWNKHWPEAIQRLTASQKFRLEDSLRRLLEALTKCRSLKLDNSLLEWSPSRWDTPLRQGTQGEWVEYRLGDEENKGRVIVCYDAQQDVIYLVTRSPTHDLTTLRELTAQFTVPRRRQPP